MVIVKRGDIWAAEPHVDVMVNPTNGVGPMGKGLAKQFAQRWPLLEPTYKLICKDRPLKIGEFAVWRPVKDPIDVVNFVTKAHWRDNGSDLEAVAGGLKVLASVTPKYGWRRMAMPALGCGLARLNWEDVHAAVLEAFHESGIEVWLYPPSDIG